MKELKIFGLNYNDKPSNIRVACRTFIVKDDKILVSYENNNNNNQLLLPGGKLEEKESLESCLIREIEEETGYIIQIKDKIVTINEYYGNCLWINHYFISEIIGDGNKLSFQEQINNRESKWVSINECLNIFKEYDQYFESDNMRYGIYQREYLALKEYLAYNELEIWDLYDKERNKLNKDHIRGLKLLDNQYHLVVHVWVKNEKGQYLISKRAKIKKYPLMWECVGGSVLKDETTYAAAIRETFEEVGIDLRKIEGKFITSFVRKEYQDIVDVYEFNYNGEASLEKATTNEVEETMWMNTDEIKELYNEGKMLKTLEYFVNNF